MQRGRGGGAPRGPPCHAIRSTQSMGDPDWLSARLARQEEGWHSPYPFVNRCLVHHSPSWLMLLNFPDHQRSVQPRNLRAARQTLAQARFPFPPAKKLICINLQAAGNPSLMIHYHNTHPFSVGTEKAWASSPLFWNWWTRHRCHLSKPPPLVSQMGTNIHAAHSRGSKYIEANGLAQNLKSGAVNGDQSGCRMFPRLSSQQQHLTETQIPSPACISASWRASGVLAAAQQAQQAAVASTARNVASLQLLPKHMKHFSAVTEVS